VVDAFPICPDHEGRSMKSLTITLISTASRRHQPRNSSAPRCFEIEDRLKKTLDHPRLSTHAARHGMACSSGLTTR